MLSSCQYITSFATPHSQKSPTSPVGLFALQGKLGRGTMGGMTTFDTYGNQLEHEALRTTRTIAIVAVVLLVARWIARRL